MLSVVNEANRFFKMVVAGVALANVFNQSTYTYVWTNHHSRFLLCWEITYCEIGAKKSPSKQSSRNYDCPFCADTTKMGVRRTMKGGRTLGRDHDIRQTKM